jgi:hypothetical protein
MATWPVISAARGVLCCVAFHHIIAPRTAAPPNRTTLKGDTLQASLMQAVTRRLIARQRQTQASREPSCRCALCCGGLGLTFAQKWSPCKCVGRPGFTAVVSRPPPVASFSLCALRLFVIKRTYSLPAPALPLCVFALRSATVCQETDASLCGPVLSVNVWAWAPGHCSKLFFRSAICDCS